jgi:hypothetical protein
MTKPAEVEYSVVLVFPSYGTERDNAETIIEEALGYLNTQKDEPGFRFAYNVSARLDTVPDLEDAQTKLRTDDSVAMMILYDLPDEERLAFTHECLAQNVPVCRTVPASESDAPPRPKAGKREPMKVVFRKRSPDDEPPAHTILDTTLIASLEDDEEALGDRVGQMIAVMALGVMEHHWKLNPPRRFFAN